MNNEFVADHIEDLTLRIEKAIENLGNLDKRKENPRIQNKIRAISDTQDYWEDIVEISWIKGDPADVFNQLGTWVDTQKARPTNHQGAVEGYSLIRDYLRSYK